MYDVFISSGASAVCDGKTIEGPLHVVCRSVAGDVVGSGVVLVGTDGLVNVDSHTVFELQALPVCVIFALLLGLIWSRFGWSRG